MFSLTSGTLETGFVTPVEEFTQHYYAPACQMFAGMHSLMRWHKGCTYMYI